MASRPCLEPDCPTITSRTRCTTHERAKDKARGTRQQRGYDAAHDALRARWAPLVATGHVKCWRCRHPIGENEPWDLGHDDIDRSKHRGPEHVACNHGSTPPSTPTRPPSPKIHRTWG